MRAHGLTGCAVRDADTLFALFVDTFGATSSIVVTDNVATRSEIVEQFRRIAASAAEHDLVFITYAGHGSDDF